MPLPSKFKLLGAVEMSADFEPVTFNYIGELQEWVVPAGCKNVRVDCVAARGKAGSSIGGKGGRVQCVLNVTPGQKLYIWVGKEPDNARVAKYNASDIRTSAADIISQEALLSRLVVAGGGASSGVAVGGPGSGGGNGGDLTGEASAEINNSYSAGGGTQISGGKGAGNADNVVSSYGKDGSLGIGGDGYDFYNDGSGDIAGGCGGAGYYGGGGGSTRMQNIRYVSASGGGGGSSYTDSELCSEVVHTQGYQDGNGYVTISML